MDRAYTILQAKGWNEDEDKFYIEGVASTPTPDRMGDSVEPMGAKFKTPMPLLWQHDASKPVGLMTFAKPDKNGIPFKAELPKIKEEGLLKQRVDEAIQSLKYKLVSAVSIGFKIMEDGYDIMESGGLRIKEWEWLELSLVTIPANSEAVLSAVKSLDREAMSASGRKELTETKRKSPGDTGIRRPIQLIPRRTS